MWNGVISKNFREEAGLNLAYEMCREKNESTSAQDTGQTKAGRRQVGGMRGCQ